MPELFSYFNVVILFCYLAEASAAALFGDADDISSEEEKRDDQDEIQDEGRRSDDEREEREMRSDGEPEQQLPILDDV